MFRAMRSDRTRLECRRAETAGGQGGAAAPIAGGASRAVSSSVATRAALMAAVTGAASGTAGSDAGKTRRDGYAPIFFCGAPGGNILRRRRRARQRGRSGYVP
jgi:hypothetical protein